MPGRGWEAKPQGPGTVLEGKRKGSNSVRLESEISLALGGRELLSLARPPRGS